MAEVESNKPVSYLVSWYESNLNLFDEYCVKHCIDKTKEGIAFVDLDTSKNISRICVWDQSNSLEIQVLNLERNESEYPVTEDGCSLEQLATELDRHLQWIKNN